MRSEDHQSGGGGRGGVGDNQDSRGRRGKDRYVQCEVIIDTNISFLAFVSLSPCKICVGLRARVARVPT